jgi:hypothetical protein
MKCLRGALIGGVAALVFAGCMAARVVGPLSPSDPSYPAEKPSPSRVIQVHGTVSATLDLSLTADYIATPRIGCTATSSLIAGSIEGATWPMSVRAPITLVRRGDEYTAQVAVDRFLPGQCGWHFYGVSAQVSKGAQSTARNTIASIPDGRTPESWHANSEPTPAVWRCRFRPAISASAFANAVACAAPARDPEHHDKHWHVITETTSSVQFNVIDLDAP